MLPFLLRHILLHRSLFSARVIIFKEPVHSVSVLLCYQKLRKVSFFVAVVVYILGLGPEILNLSCITWVIL